MTSGGGQAGIRLVRSGPSRRVRPGRIAAAVSGLVLVVAGVLLLLPVIFLVVLFAVFAATGSDVSAPPATTVLAVIGAAVAGIVLWILGAKLLRGRPRTVLFLRRFGFDQAKDFISHAAAQALGRRWRLVTLDDLATTPVGTRPWKRWALRLSVLAALLLVAWLFYEAVQIATGDSSGTIDQAVDEATADAENAIDEFVTGIVVAIVMAIVIAIATVIAVAMFALIVAVVGALGLVTFVANRSLARAERDEWTPARTREELIGFIDRIRAHRSKLFAPRIAVVRVVDRLWKEAVSGLADISDVVLVDISDPTESLQWELEMLSRRPDVELVVVGSADRLAALVATGGHDADDRAVLDILGSRTVLVYDEDRKRFARALRRTLEAAAINDRSPARR